MCRSLRVLCAAPSPEELAALKRAAVSSDYELVGGATDRGGVVAQVREWVPDVVVAPAALLGREAIEEARAWRPELRWVVVGGDGDGADAVAAALEEVRETIRGLPRPGGPVR
ncbi:MAG TPA: hypothetical protein VEO00_13080 [Actinomycetota bacterium]|nr:hypothetical protein [Actinomycetota bacterium]